MDRKKIKIGGTYTTYLGEEIKITKFIENKENTWHPYISDKGYAYNERGFCSTHASNNNINFNYFKNIKSSFIKKLYDKNKIKHISYSDYYKVHVTREKGVLRFDKPSEDEYHIFYDMKTNQMKRYKKGELKYIVQDYYFFSSVYNVKWDFIEPKFKELIVKVRELNPGCNNVSNFIRRLSQAQAYESFIQEGIKTGWRSHLSIPANRYDKNVIKAIKYADYIIGRSFQDGYFNNKNLFEKIINIMMSLENITPDKAHKVFKEMVNGYHMLSLIRDFNYDIKSLLNQTLEYYLPFENVNFRDACSLLYDYYRMANIIGRDVKKYPRYLKSIHDIIAINFKAYKKEYDEELFKKVVSTKKELEYEGKKYAIKLPESPKDIIQEGTDLHHCVGSYVDKIIEGDTLIIFLRETNSKDCSLVTVEYRNNSITQAKGSCNRAMNKDERQFLEKYCQQRKIELRV